MERRAFGKGLTEKSRCAIIKACMEKEEYPGSVCAENPRLVKGGEASVENTPWSSLLNARRAIREGRVRPVTRMSRKTL